MEYSLQLTANIWIVSVSRLDSMVHAIGSMLLSIVAFAVSPIAPQLIS